jgi:hypothetical protein
VTVLLTLVMGSVFADARTASVFGPGVDVFVRTAFPGEGGTIVLDVEARGGNRAGIEAIEVKTEGQTLALHRGNGATWGSAITQGRHRGSDTETVRLAVPGHLEPIDKRCGMCAGSRSSESCAPGSLGGCLSASRIRSLPPRTQRPRATLRTSSTRLPACSRHSQSYRATLTRSRGLPRSCASIRGIACRS